MFSKTEAHKATMLRWLGAATILATQVVGESAGATPSPRSLIDWPAVTARDTAAIHHILDREYIYASYPPRSKFALQLQRADARAATDAKAIKDFAGYRATLLRYLATFADPHLLLVFNLKAATYRWPQFAVRAEGDRYRVTYTELSDVAVGATVDRCDGKRMDAWADALLTVENGLQGRPGPRARIAPWVFVDQNNPLVARPQKCVIGGVEHMLEWESVPADRLAQKTGLGLPVEMPLGLTTFGTDGAWIRLPAMDPDTPAQAATWHALIDHAADLRDRKTIVFDVRGNVGGSYEWFMAVLRSLYGEEYIRYFARARLQIRPIFVGRLPAEPVSPSSSAAAPTDPLRTPSDAALDRAVSVQHYLVTRAGRTLTALDPGAPSDRQAPVGSPPANLVRSKVYVLADSGCASACVSFIDEMKSIPGVIVVGGPTQVDMRSGSPIAFPLPSGLVRIYVPSMVREGRQRGENIGYVPDIPYDGDLAATGEIQRWIAALP